MIINIMQKPLFISSKMAGAVGPSHDFRVKFSPSLDLKGSVYVALNSVSTKYRWYNIRKEYNNNIFTYTNDTTTNPISWIDITLKDGIYTYDQSNEIIRDQIMRDSKAYSSSDPGLNFKMNYSISRVYLYLAPNFEVNLQKMIFENY